MKARQIVVPGSSRRFRAFLTMPSRSARGGVVPLHPASDPSKDQLLFRHLCRILPPSGVAVLRFDRPPSVTRARTSPSKTRPRTAWRPSMLLHPTCRVRTCRSGSGVGAKGPGRDAGGKPIGSGRFSHPDRVHRGSPAAQMRYGTAETSEGLGLLGDFRRPARSAECFRGGDPRVPVSTGPRRRDSSIAARTVLGFDRPGFSPSFRPNNWKDMDYDPIPSFEKIAVPTLLFTGRETNGLPSKRACRPGCAPDGFPGDKDITILRLPGATHAPTIGGKMTPNAISPEYSRSMTAWIESHFPRPDGGDS